MVPEPSDRTVRIPIQWIDGQWQLVGGGKLPKLVNNACADLVMPAIFLADEDQRARWSEEITVPFLPKGTELFARVSLNKVPVNLQDKTESKPYVSGVPSRFVKIVLDADLSLSLTLGKKGRLSDCNCTIPAMNDTAKSVNEAYKKIVTVFEPKRRSTAGNVFSLVWLERDGRVVSLDDIREQRTTAAASNAARPRERSETWDELATKWSQVYELWAEPSNDSETVRPQDASNNNQARFVFPETDGNALKESGEAFFNHRLQMLSRYGEGLESILNRFDDPQNTAADIKELRELKDAMDRAVLEAYGWHDLAQTATCEFLLDYEENEDDEEVSSGRRRKKPRRYRWPDPFRDEVLARLLALNAERAEQELLSDHAAEAADGGGKGRKKSVNATKAGKKSTYQASLPGLEFNEKDD